MSKSTWAFIDQGVFAFSNFLLNVYLARSLPSNDYGAFALAYTVFLFVAVVHTSFFTEPLLVFGSGRYEDAQSSYLRRLIKLHWIWGSLGASILVFFGALIYWDNEARSTILLLAALSGVLLFQWMMRRACYLRQQSKIAGLAGIIYFVIVILGIYLANHYQILGTQVAVLILALACFISASFIQWKLFKIKLLSSEKNLAVKEVVKTHLDYGKWALTMGIIGWIAGNVAMISLPWWHGNSSVANFRAALNLALPVQQLLAAAGPLLVPFLVRKRNEKTYRSTVLKCAVAFAIPPLVWALFLTIFGNHISNFIYEGKYVFSETSLLLLGLWVCFGTYGLVIATALRACEKPKLALRGYAVAAGFSLCLGVPMIACWGIIGAFWSLIMAATVGAIINTITFYGFTKPESNPIKN